MFCSCSANHFRVKPNTHLCPVCLGLPGALPVPNQKAIEWTALIAAALNCKISHQSHFDRKNYFYPDLPKGYQISQHFKPIGRNGQVTILSQNKFIDIPISDIHLEEDTAKLIHKNKETLIDFNRSGVPLVEIVSAPTIRSPLEAKLYLRRIQQIIRWLGISDGDMEKGTMRCEANISLAKSDRPLSRNLKKLPPYRTELKNINSFRFVEIALELEIQRQTRILRKGKTPAQETRGYNPDKKTTFVQRSKETAPDYRYFPEPDIPPFTLPKTMLDKLKNQINSMPWEEEKFLIAAGLSRPLAQLITADKALLIFFKKLIPLAKKQKTDIIKLANLIINKKVSLKNKTPAQLLTELGKQKEGQLGKKAITEIAKTVIAANAKAVEDYQAGKAQALGPLIGQVVKESGGKADPQRTAKILTELL